MNERDVPPLSQDEMQSAIGAALAAILTTEHGGALRFSKETLKFSGAIHVKFDDEFGEFTVVDTRSRN